MPERFLILGSSSSGNCALLETEQARILIDVGFSGRKTEQLLQRVGLTPHDIQAVFLTHEHQDHSSGVRGLCRYPHLEFFANMDTAQALQEKLSRKVKWKIFETNSSFVYQDLEVQAITAPHDAYDPVCFFFQWGHGDLFSPRRSLGWINDLGHVPEAILRRIARSEILVIESNYDETMLEADTKRPWSLKQRIRGRHGHLSNEETLQALKRIENPQWTHIFLTHLSRECNSVSLVEKVFGTFIQSMPRTVHCSVVPPDGETILPCPFGSQTLVG